MSEERPRNIPLLGLACLISAITADCPAVILLRIAATKSRGGDTDWASWSNNFLFFYCKDFL